VRHSVPRLTDFVRLRPRRAPAPRAARRIATGLVLGACLSCVGVVGDGGGAGDGAGAGVGAGAEGRSSPGASPGPATPAPAPGSAAATAPSSRPADPARPFACRPAAQAATPARMWRLTAAQYANTIKTLPGLDAASYANPLDGADSQRRFKNDAETLGMPDVVMDSALRVARDLSAPAVARLRSSNPCLASPDAACVRAAYGPLAAKAFRRPAADDELGRLVTLVTGNVAALGVQGALELGVQSLLMSPHFLYRLELGEARADAAGRRRLTPHEIASALSYTLADGPPDSMLAAAAAQNALATSEQIRAHALRLLGSAPGQNRALARFLREYLGYDNAPNIFKDPKAHPYHAPVELVADTDAWLRDVLNERKDLLKTLFTAPWGYARQKTAGSYGLAAAPAAAARADFPAGQRAGILTQPSFLVSFSGNEENDPIRRGKFIAQSLLCIGLPDSPPEDVPPLPPAPDATLRERLEVHRNAKPNCVGCHRIMDPLGLGLEGYDHTGRHRTTEAGKPVDTRGEIVGTGTAIDGPFDGALALGAKLASAPVVEQCFVRHGLRYLFGREERDGDGCALEAAHEALGRSGGDVVEVVAALVTSESFLYRLSP
jgi:hypothetical protein